MEAALFFQLVSGRHEKGSIILTSNRSYGSWGYANLVTERTAKITAESTAKEIARELEKILAERGQKKKIAELIKKLKQE